MKVGVIGAGPAGLTAAYLLAKQGIDVDIYEKDSQVGGMARTFELWGQKVDVGPHRFFSSDARVNRLWLEVVKNDYKMIDRLTRIYYQKKFFYYPLQPISALKTMGISQALLCGMSYLKEKIKSDKSTPESFESFIVKRFGKRLFNTFFKTYTEKLWGITCQELDSDFASQRIKKFSLGEAIKTALGVSKNQHKTLVDKFAYPIEGTGMVYQRMSDAVKENAKSNVYLNTSINGVIVDGNKVVGIATDSNKKIYYDHVVSTMPLTKMVKSTGNLPDNVKKAVSALSYRNTIIVYLYLKESNLFPDQWLYVHDPRISMGRLTNFRNWISDINKNDPGSILALEYWCNTDDPIWSEDDEVLINKGKEEVALTGLISGVEKIVKGRVLRIPRSYPVYKKGYKYHLDIVYNYLKKFDNVTAIGRYGSFKYNNQDHSILMGMMASENIIKGNRNNDLWKINTDYETYQESSKIDESGLVFQQ